MGERRGCTCVCHEMTIDGRKKGLCIIQKPKDAKPDPPNAQSSLLGPLDA
jgi:hypothetical protein